MSGGWSTTKPKARRENVKMEDLWDMFDLSDGEYHQGRGIGPITSIEQHWVEIITGKGKKVSIPKTCLDYNSATEEYDKNTKKVKGKTKVVQLCPYCKAGIRGSRTYLQNFIDREAQADAPGKPVPPKGTEAKAVTKTVGKEQYKARWKTPKSKTWTPCRVVRVPNTLATKFQSLEKTNKHVVKGKNMTFDVSHPKYGVDLNLKYDADAPGTSKYDASKEDKTRLTEEELEYVLHDLTLYVPETPEQAQAEWANLQTKLAEAPEEEGDEDEDDEDEDDSRSRRKLKGGSKKTGKLGKASRKSDDDEDEDLEDYGDIEDFDDLMGGKKKKSSGGKSRNKSGKSNKTAVSKTKGKALVKSGKRKGR